MCIIVYIYNIDCKPPSDLCFCWRSTLENLEKKTIFFQTRSFWLLGAKIYRYHIYLIIDVWWRVWLVMLQISQDSRNTRWWCELLRRCPYTHFISGGFLSTKPSAARVAFSCYCQGIWKSPTRTIYPKNDGWDPTKKRCEWLCLSQDAFGSPNYQFWDPTIEYHLSFSRIPRSKFALA